MAKGKRVNRVVFLLTDEELGTIQEKMAQLGITNASAYLRKMAIDGFVLTLNMPELKELLSLMRYNSNNLNQLAKRMNAGGRIYEDDLKEIHAQQQVIWEGINEILVRLGKTI
ncbi:MAG: plasmid mobilization relaxosome protein MobC [Clostridia bacterium]